MANMKQKNTTKKANKASHLPWENVKEHGIGGKAEGEILARTVQFYRQQSFIRKVKLRVL